MIRSIVLSMVVVTALSAVSGRAADKVPQKKTAYLPIRAFPAAGRLWQVGWWEGERFVPARLLLGPDGQAVAILRVRNETLGDFTALLCLLASDDALRLAYGDSLGQAWKSEAREAAQFALPCPTFARDVPLTVVVRPAAETSER